MNHIYDVKIALGVDKWWCSAFHTKRYYPMC